MKKLGFLAFVIALSFVGNVAFARTPVQVSVEGSGGVSTGSSGSGVMCTMQYQPVCAAKQVQCIKAPCYPVYQTYGNSCTAGADNATVIHEGECLPNETGPVKPDPTPAPRYIPPTNCTAWFDGCNSCSKMANGQVACTMRACMDTPNPGYCTAYRGSVHATSSTDTTATSSTSVHASTSVPMMPRMHFFARFWASFLGWFQR